MVKQLRQVAGVERVKVQDFKKGIFAVSPRRGVTLSESSLLAAVRRSGFTPQRIVAPENRAAPPPNTTAPSPPSDEVEKLLAGSRDAFRKEDFNDALKGALNAAHKKPLDATVQQFVSLVYFALGNYNDAASTAHTALHNGPHWKWERLRGHYVKTEVYTSQLRALEKFVREHPASSESRFLLGYHYLMLGHTKAGRSLLSRVAEQKPADKLIRRLLELEKKEGTNAPSQQRD